MNLKFWAEKARTNQEIITALEYALKEMKKVKKNEIAPTVSFLQNIGANKIVIKIETN